jgi:uncharacterized repeat protein (TIGR01451 family)
VLPVLVLAMSGTGGLWADPTFVNAADPTLPDQARGVPKGGALTIFDLDLEAEGSVTLELERFAVFADDAKLTLVGDAGTTQLNLPGDAWFRGWADHDPNSLVVFAVSEDGSARGLITGSNGAWLLESHPGKGRGLLNRKVDLETELGGREFSCGAEPATSPAGGLSGGDGSDAASAAGIPTNVIATAHIIVDTDFEYLQRFGGDAVAALTFLGDVFAYSSGLYEREINTNLLITSARLFSTNNDPYEATNAGCGDYGGLDEVQDEWSGNSTPRTLVHLVSGKSVGQGCAYVGVLCSQSDGYGASMGIRNGYGGGTFNIDDPDVFWDNMVVAHEIGHNFASPHTHNYCGVGGIADPVDNCVEADPHPDDVGDSCYNVGAPTLPGPGSLTGGSAGTGNGTIMSYCHFRAGGFDNFSWTFGEYHPDGVAPFRVVDVMRAHVAANTSCMALEYTGPDVAVYKDCKPDDPALVGETGICTIVVENNGPELALGVVAEDLYISNGTFSFGTISATKGDDPMAPDTCTASANPQNQSGDVTCDLGDIAAGHAVTIEIPITAEAPQNVNDRVSVASESPDPDMTNNMAEDSLTFYEEADLAVSKLCKPDGDLLAGEDGVCTIVVDNLGPSDAENVQVRDIHVSSQPFTIDGVQPGGSCSVTGSEVSCTFATLLAGDSEQIVITIRENEAMDINNSVSVTSDTADSNSANNVASDGLHIVGLADLGISKSDSPDPVNAGEELTYTLTVQNDGPSTATNVVVTDAVPAGTAMVSAAASQGSCLQGVPGDPAQPSVCTLGDLASSGSATVTLVVAVLPATTGTLLNDASVSSDTLDTNNANNSASSSTQVNVVTGVSVTKSDDKDPVIAGTELRYTIEVGNAGPSTATQLSIVDTLPAEVSLIGLQVEEGSGNCIESGAGEITCDNIGDLAPGERFKVVITVLVDAAVPDGTTITNEVDLLEDDVLSQETAEDTLVEARADLWIDKKGNFPTGNSSGTIIYYLTVHNDAGCSQDDPQVCGAGGPSNALNVVVTDIMPSTAKKLRVEFVSENCLYDEATHTVTCSELVLAAGDSVTFEIQATPKGNLGPINNVADVASDTYDPDTGNNHDELLMTVQGGTGDTGGPGDGRGKGPKPKG